MAVKIMDEISLHDYIAVDIHGLCKLLCCGRDTARRIGAEANARIRIGRRILYDTAKIREYTYYMA